VGELARGGAVVSRPGTRVDGHSPLRTRELVLQVNTGSREEGAGCLDIV
jgi:hypothetical protein